MPQGDVDPHLLLAVAEGFEQGMVGALLDPAADPRELLREPPADLPPRVRRRLLDPDLPDRAAAIARRAADQHLTLLTPASPGYPPRLRSMPLRPNALFVAGAPAALTRALAVAVVGTRTATPYGTAAAEAFANALAQAGCCIWSGLARGIDAIAHRANLAARTPTVAVLAGGLDLIYPPEHRQLATAIVDAGGCLCSELPPGMPARRGHFPRRNRILAAADAVLVVEAGATSGALHTARFAADQGRAVFAVPGPWTSPLSRGCHRLLQDGAAVAADPEELLRDLGVQPSTPAPSALALQDSADAQAVLRCLRAGPRPADLVQRESGLPRSQFLAARLALESQGLARTLPGDLLAIVGT